MANKEYRVECSTHGTSPGTFVCQHLKTGENLGFHLGYDPDNPDSLYPDAWCADCEQEYKLGEYERWDWDQDTSQLVFSHAGQAKVICDI